MDVRVRQVGMKRIALCLIVLVACGDDGGSGGGADAAVQGSCFYSCNTNFGTLYGCTSEASLTSSATCTTNAETKCGSSSVGRSEFSTCQACDDSCAPGWHNP